MRATAAPLLVLIAAACGGTQPSVFTGPDAAGSTYSGPGDCGPCQYGPDGCDCSNINNYGCGGGSQTCGPSDYCLGTGALGYSCQPVPLPCTQQMWSSHWTSFCQCLVASSGRTGCTCSSSTSGASAALTCVSDAGPDVSGDASSDSAPDDSGNDAPGE